MPGDIAVGALRSRKGGSEREREREGVVTCSDDL